MGVDQAIDITAEERKTVLSLLEQHLPGTAAWVYGSRAKWTSRPQSDLDLVVFPTPEQQHRVGDLREAFEESDLPFRVDLFVWDEVPETFRLEIEEEHATLVSTPRERTIFNWRETRWGDIATLEYGRALRAHSRGKGAFRVYGTNGPIGWHHEVLCKNPGVIVGRKGAYRGIHYSVEPFFVIDTAFYLKPKEELEARWAYYALLTQDINGMDSGSAIPSTSREEFYSLPVSVPPPTEQRAIAHILGTLDDKIELNRRMNETLEAMARALFKSWFVDFDPVRAKMEGRDTGLPKDVVELFPDRLLVSEIGEVPEGWKLWRLGELGKCQRRTIEPYAHPDLEFELFSIPAHDSGKLSNREKGSDIRSIKTLVPAGAVLLSKLNPEIPRVWMPAKGADGRQVCSTEFLVFTPSDIASRSLLYSLFTDASFRTMLQSMVTGTSKSHQRVPVKALTDRKVLFGTPSVFRAFGDLVAPVFSKTVENRSQSSNLVALRDALLPKLVSGELRTNGDNAPHGWTGR